MKNLSEYLEKNKCHWGDCYLIMTIHMIGPYGDFLKIHFPYTKPDEVIRAIKSLEIQGYSHCSWVRYILRFLISKILKDFRIIKRWIID